MNWTFSRNYCLGTHGDTFIHCLYYNSSFPSYTFPELYFVGVSGSCLPHWGTGPFPASNLINLKSLFVLPFPYHGCCRNRLLVQIWQNRPEGKYSGEFLRGNFFFFFLVGSAIFPLLYFGPCYVGGHDPSSCLSLF